MFGWLKGLFRHKQELKIRTVENPKIKDLPVYDSPGVLADPITASLVNRVFRDGGTLFATIDENGQIRYPDEKLPE